MQAFFDEHQAVGNWSCSTEKFCGRAVARVENDESSFPFTDRRVFVLSTILARGFCRIVEGVGAVGTLPHQLVSWVEKNPLATRRYCRFAPTLICNHQINNGCATSVSVSPQPAQPIPIQRRTYNPSRAEAKASTGSCS